jgi:hypothetical protein
MLRSATTGPFMGVITVASWLKTLSPAAVAEYYFSSYNSLLSHMALELLLDEDFPRTEEQADTPTVANLKTAVAELYAGSTLAIRNERNKLHLAITVPGGEGDTWPAQIQKPGAITYPTVGVLPHEVK